MSYITSWLWGTSQLDDAVDKATSELIPTGSEDIALNLEICDQIRSKSVPTKDAMRALKRRINHKNPNVQMLALGLTDICIKNGGDHFLVEVASREFIDNLVSLLKTPALNHDVRNTALRLIQNWAITFEGKPSLSYVGQVYKDLKSEGFKFPPRDPVVANAAMVDTQTAPEWIDSDVCLRCRTPFTFTNRKHHCRNCGQVFDQACSSKSMPLPHFGITQDVRVCDGCHTKLTRKAERSHGSDNKGHRHSSSGQGGLRHRSARDLDDEELQRAIQMSLQELNMVTGNSRPGYTPYQPTPSEPPLVDRSSYNPSKPRLGEEDDPDLRAAIEASLREANAPRPSAPVDVETPRTETIPSFPHEGRHSYIVPPHPPAQKLPNYDLGPLESDAILTFSQTVEEVHTRGGRDMSRYPAVTELYDKANGLRPKLAMNLDDAGRKEKILSEMHDKLSQAVKLYDQLLTQQISQPRWRATLPAMSPSISSQQTTQGYNPGVALQDNQPLGPQQMQVGAVPGTPRLEQAIPPPQTQSFQTYPGAPLQDYGAQRANLVAPNTYPPENVSQQHQQSPQPQPQLPQFPQNSITTPGQNRLVQTYQQPLEPSQSAPWPTHVVQNPGLAYVENVPSTAPQATAPLIQHSTPVHLSQSPPPAQQQHISQFTSLSQSPQPLPPTRQPTRHATITGMPRAAYLSRHNTIAHAPIHQHVQQQSPAMAFPQFPVAPTTAPQAFPLYGPSAPTSAPQSERKEALLIDL